MESLRFLVSCSLPRGDVFVSLVCRLFSLLVYVLRACSCCFYISPVFGGNVDNRLV